MCNRYTCLMVTSSAEASQGQVAPGDLEPIRSLLNSWLIPNDTRQPTDNFDELAREQGWRPREAAVVRELRDDVRRVVEAGDARALNGWVERTDIRPMVEDGSVSYQHAAGPAGDILAAVLSAISAGTWTRLKACPDCRWVFYDNTRNGSKRWCLMYGGGPDGRACGTIAKVRRYRDRQAAAGPQ
jgi:predicted RNA-binding Zn ribbon-like protein